MLHRIASLILVIVTCSFFVLHKLEGMSEPLKFVNIILPEPARIELIAHNEYLILMEQGASLQVPQVLSHFGLTLASPLGEWLHVVRGNAREWQEIIPWNSHLAKEDRELLARLEAHPDIHSAHANFIEDRDAGFSSCSFSPKAANQESLLTIPKDPLFASQWYLQKSGGLNIHDAWSITTGSANNLIAVVDHHFQFSESDLIPDRCPSRKYFYENVTDYFWQQKFPGPNNLQNHGTQVLSILAPCTDNNIALAAIDWHAQVFAVDTGDDRSLSGRLSGIIWAAGIDACKSSIVPCPAKKSFQVNRHPANIINASFGFAGAYLKEPAYGPVLDVIGLINRQGTILVASAGNEGELADRRLPGSAGGVLSVAASNFHKRSASFSNWGQTVDVEAPGEELPGLQNGIVSLNGTSFAAPIVAAIISLMLSVAPELTWKQAEYILKETAQPMTCGDYCPASMDEEQQIACKKYCCQGEKSICAAGIVDAGAAVLMASKGIPKVPLIDLDDYFLPLSAHNNMSMKLRVKNGGGAAARVRLKKSHEHLKITPEEFLLPPINANSFPSSREVIVYYDEIPTTELVLDLVFEASHPDNPEQYTDRIEAIVEIVPDQISGPKQHLELKHFNG